MNDLDQNIAFQLGAKDLEILKLQNLIRELREENEKLKETEESAEK